MKKLSDDELIIELKQRFEQNTKALEKLKNLNQKLKEVNTKLIDSEKLKSNFLTNIRNEINNPLTAILGLAGNLRDENPQDAETIKKLGKMIYEEAFGLNLQLQTIFAAAELEAGESLLQISNIDVPGMLQQLIKAYEHWAKDEKLKIIFRNELSEENGNTFCFKTDADKFHLILANLLANAIEFGRDGDRIELRVWYENKKLGISIQDFGEGIYEVDQQKIFDRFVQLDTGFSKQFRGHGLGLSVAKGAVELLNGSISLDSKVKEGSLFTVILHEIESEFESEVLSLDEDGVLF